MKENCISEFQDRLSEHFVAAAKNMTRGKNKGLHCAFSATVSNRTGKKNEVDLHTLALRLPSGSFQIYTAWSYRKNGERVTLEQIKSAQWDEKSVLLPGKIENASAFAVQELDRSEGLMFYMPIKICGDNSNKTPSLKWSFEAHDFKNPVKEVDIERRKNPDYQGRNYSAPRFTIHIT